MKQSVTIVYYELQGKKMYLSEMSFREDNRILPMWNADKQQAHQFEDEPHARQKICRFVNHHSRTFFTERIIAEVSKANPFPKRILQAAERIS